METNFKYPILYTFRRCPYAMRARFAIRSSKIIVEIREIKLQEKPLEFLKLSPKGTVPVLITNSGEVLEESLDIIYWALNKNDPHKWLAKGKLENHEIIKLLDDLENDTMPSKSIFSVIAPPLILIFLVLGSILAGVATPTESAAVGAIGACILASIRGKLSVSMLTFVSRESVKITSMIFMILIGASLFSLVFRGFGGDELIEHFLINLPGGEVGAFLIVMVAMFLMGFFLDFIEIIFIMVPLVGPPLIGMGFDPIWLGVMIAVNLQTSFLTPPFGFSLFYLRGVAPSIVKTTDIYLGVMPFIGLQLLALLIFWTFPEIITWLPKLIF